MKARNHSNVLFIRCELLGTIMGAESVESDIDC